MLTKQAQIDLYSYCYDQGVTNALKQAGLSKVAKPNKQTSKKEQSSKVDSSFKGTKDVILKTKELSQLKNMSDKATTAVDKLISRGVKQLPKNTQNIANKAVGKGKSALKSKLVGAIEPLYVGYKALTPQGRQDLIKEYPVTAPKPKSIKDAVVDPLTDVVSFASAPLTISGLAAGARTYDRAQKGSKVHQKAIQDAALKGNTKEVRRLVSADPRYRF